MNGFVDALIEKIYYLQRSETSKLSNMDKPKNTHYHAIIVSLFYYWLLKLARNTMPTVKTSKLELFISAGLEKAYGHN